ncbi:MAG: M42 family metallopeptidase [Candidatus Sumerlaeota bacterium]|nr:M42 family metallopeptidase [Candidatus Sumerlaeota bacterium]
MDSSIALLRELSEADGPPGFEDEVRAIFRRRLSSICDIRQDRLGSLLCEKRGTAERPRILLDCHMDEVGFMVRLITKEGFLRFLTLGGWTGHVLSAQRVRVATAAGKVEGVIGSVPPHFLSADKRSKAVSVDELAIDVGASSRDEAESWGIRLGAWIAPATAFARMKDGKHLLGKAFDNRVGCALCIETLELAAGAPNTLIGSGSAQEEVGSRGATTAALTAEPDLAIVLEGPPADDTPGLRREESQGALGRGVQIRAYDPSMIANPRLFEFARSVAEEENTPHQIAVRTSGGTDASKIHVSRHGVPSIVLGVPVRYAHSHQGVMHVDDYLAARALALAMVKRLDAATVEKF